MTIRDADRKDLPGFVAKLHASPKRPARIGGGANAIIDDRAMEPLDALIAQEEAAQASMTGQGLTRPEIRAELGLPTHEQNRKPIAADDEPMLPNQAAHRDRKTGVGSTQEQRRALRALRQEVHAANRETVPSR